MIFSDQKPNGRNELTYREDGYGDRHDYHETFPVPEERDSLADSFDAVVNVARRYSAERTADGGPDEIGVPDAVDAGDGADTFFSDVTVKGLKYADARNVTVSFGDGLVIIIVARAASSFSIAPATRAVRRCTRRSAGRS